MGGRPGHFLLKHFMDAESLLGKLLDIETFRRLLYQQISRVENCPELKLVGRRLGGSTYQLVGFSVFSVYLATVEGKIPC